MPCGLTFATAVQRVLAGGRAHFSVAGVKRQWSFFQLRNSVEQAVIGTLARLALSDEH
jgi:hypothetical protein